MTPVEQENTHHFRSCPRRDVARATLCRVRQLARGELEHEHFHVARLVDSHHSGATTSALDVRNWLSRTCQLCPRDGATSLGKTVSGGFEPGGLIERMKAMIFQS